MVFPDQSYVSFNVTKTSTVFSFPTKKPRKIKITVSEDDVSLNIKYNNNSAFVLYLNRYTQPVLEFGEIINSISISSNQADAFTVNLIVFEWGN